MPGAPIEDLDVGLQHPEVEGRCDDLATAMPLASVAHQQALVQPAAQEGVFMRLVQQPGAAQHPLHVGRMEEHHAEGVGTEE